VPKILLTFRGIPDTPSQNPRATRNPVWKTLSYCDKSCLHTCLHTFSGNFRLCQHGSFNSYRWGHP